MKKKELYAVLNYVFNKGLETQDAKIEVLELKVAGLRIQVNELYKAPVTSKRVE